jgi:hypothetical protein
LNSTEYGLRLITRRSIAAVGTDALSVSTPSTTSATPPVGEPAVNASTIDVRSCASLGRRRSASGSKSIASALLAAASTPASRLPVTVTSSPKATFIRIVIGSCAVGTVMVRSAG